MRPARAVLVVCTLLGFANMACSEISHPWGTYDSMPPPGRYSMRLENYRLTFEFADLAGATRPGLDSDIAREIDPRSDTFLSWVKASPNRTWPTSVGCFGVHWEFYPLGIKLLGRTASTGIGIVLYTGTSRGPSYDPIHHTFVNHKGEVVPLYIEDYRNPEELLKKFDVAPGTGHSAPAKVAILSRGQMSLERSHAAKHITPAEEVIINNRKWYRRLENSGLYPQALKIRYVTGLAQDRYLEVSVSYDPAPVYSDYYPRIPAEADQPDWLRQSIQYANQVLSSIRLTPVDPNAPPDLYEVAKPVGAKTK